MTEPITAEETNHDTDTDAPETETETPQDVGAEGTPASDTDTDTAETNADGSELAREARKWRKQYQSSKTENEALTATVGALQRQLVDQAITHRIADTSDFWTQVSIADLLAEDGTLDPALIETKVTEVLAAKPHWTKRAPAAAPTSGVGTGIIEGDEPKRSWTQLLSRDNRQQSV